MSNLRSALDELAASDPAEMDIAGLGETIADLIVDQEVLHAQLLRRLAVFARGQGFELNGYTSAVSWLIGRCGLAPGRARDLVRMARSLARMPVTMEAFLRGELDSGRVRHLVAARDAHPEPFAAAEEELVDLVQGVSSRQVHRLIDYWRQNLDHELALRDAEKLHERRYLNVSPTYGGLTRVDGDFYGDDGAVIVEAVNAVADAAARDAADARSPGQRRADAIVDICRLYLDQGATPTAGGVKPHVTVIVELETLERRAGKRCEILDGHVIPPETARRLACDAGVSRVITAGPSEPLDVGRTMRTVPAAIRRALIVRDGGCAMEGCGRPARWCDAHHIVHWVDGGPTRLENLVLLCRFHHRLVHEGRLRLRAPP